VCVFSADTGSIYIYIYIYILINSQHRHESVVVFLLQKNKKCFSRYMQVTKVYIQ